MTGHRPTIAASVEWAPGTATDITSLLVSAAVHHGGQSSAVERPTAAPADGHLVLDTPPTAVAHRTARYRLTLTADTRAIWTGWLSQPSPVDERRKTRWRLTGLSLEALERTAEVSRPAGSVTATIGSVSLDETGATDPDAGATVAQRSLTDRNHRALNSSGPTGEILSLLAGAVSAEFCERRDGGLVMSASSPSARPADPTQVSADAMHVGLVVASRLTQERVRNQVLVQTSGGFEIVPTEYRFYGREDYQTRTGSRVRDGALPLAFGIAFPQDGLERTNPRLTVTRFRISWWGLQRDDPHRRTGLPTFVQRTDGYSARAWPRSMVVNERGDLGDTLTGTLTIPADQPARHYFTLEQLRDRPPAGVTRARTADPAGRWWLGPNALPVDGVVSLWAHTIDWAGVVTVDQEGDPLPPVWTTVVDEESQRRWGVRELRRPDWLVDTTASAAALLAVVGQPRREHVLTLPLQQPTAALSRRAADLDCGDYVTLTMRDPARGVLLVDVHGVVTDRRLSLNDVGEAHTRLTVLETGLLPAAPGAPTGLTVTPTAGGLALSWTAPTAGGAVAEYDVQWGTGGGYDTGATAVTGTSHAIAGLAGGTEYSVRVRARNTGGASAWTTGTGTPILAPPGAPPNLTAAAASPTTVRASWSRPVTGGVATSYTLAWRRTGTSSWTERTGLTTTTAVIPALTMATSYDLRVRAVGPGGAGAWSEAVTAVTPPSPPGAPTGLDVASAAGGLALTWTAPTTGGAVAEYRVQWGTGTSYTAGEATVTGTSHTISGLAAGTTYAVRVRAENAGGASAWTTGSGRPTDPPPGPPRNLAAAAASTTSIRATWERPATGETTSFTLAHRRTGTASWTETTGLTVGASTITGLAMGAAYDVRVRAVGPGGAGPWTPTATATTPTSPPGPPSGLTAAAGDASAALSWTAPTTGGAPTAYDVRWRPTSSSGAWTSSETATTALTVTGLANGTPYTFEVRSRNAGGSSSWVSATATPAVPPTGRPRNLAARATSTTEVTVTWDAPATGSPPTSYTLEWRAAASSTWTERTGILGTTAGLSGLGVGTRYLARVRAVSRAGPGPWTQPVTVVTRTVAPGPPTGLAAAAGDAVVTLSWTAPTTGGPPAGYDLRWRPTGSSGNWTETATTATTLTASGLTNGTPYTFEVRATNSAGDSSWVSATATPTPPAPAGNPVHLGSDANPVHLGSDANPVHLGSNTLEAPHA